MSPAYSVDFRISIFISWNCYAFLPDLIKGGSFPKLVICGTLFIISGEREILMH